MKPIPEYEIVVDGKHRIASNGLSTVTLDGGNMFKRNAIKKAGTPEAYKEQWLVAELEGVRCYVRQMDNGIGVVMTKEDLYP